MCEPGAVRQYAAAGLGQQPSQPSHPGPSPSPALPSSPTRLPVEGAEAGERHVELVHHCDEQHRVAHCQLRVRHAPHAHHHAAGQAHPHHSRLHHGQDGQERHLPVLGRLRRGGWWWWWCVVAVAVAVAVVVCGGGGGGWWLWWWRWRRRPQRRLLPPRRSRSRQPLPHNPHRPPLPPAGPCLALSPHTTTTAPHHPTPPPHPTWYWRVLVS